MADGGWRIRGRASAAERPIVGRMPVVWVNAQLFTPGVLGAQEELSVDPHLDRMPWNPKSAIRNPQLVHWMLIPPVVPSTTTVLCSAPTESTTVPPLLGSPQPLKTTCVPPLKLALTTLAR